jgi:hypothetical protein
MFTKAQERDYYAIVAHTWVDEGFRKKFLADPRKVLSEHGINFPDFIEVTVADGSSQGKFALGLPARPANLSDEAIRNLVVTPSPAGCI